MALASTRMLQREPCLSVITCVPLPPTFQILFYRHLRRKTHEQYLEKYSYMAASIIRQLHHHTGPVAGPSVAHSR
jgi:hypothetical protein